MILQKLIPIYQYSAIEDAVQQLFCNVPQGPFIKPDPKWNDSEDEVCLPDGQVAFYTAKQNNSFQKARPRIGIALHSINDFEGMRKADAPDFVLRSTAWRAQMRFAILTKPDYDFHDLVRASVLAIIPLCQPTYQPDGTGITAGGLNGILQYHQVGQFEWQNEATTITPQEGYYRSNVQVNLTFSVKVAVWADANNQ